MTQQPTVSAVIPAWNEQGNIGKLVERISNTLRELGLSFEVIIVDGGSKDNTKAEAESAGAKVILQKRTGYGGALREGFMAARGQWIVTMDADLSHPPELIKELWAKKDCADIVVASRFISGGKSEAPTFRQWLSKFLNKVFSSVLSVPISDSSSGYRLYNRRVLRPTEYQFENFNILQEVLISAYCDGFSVAEVALHYGPRGEGESHVSFVKFALSYIPTLYKMWVLRHSLSASDYESRAFNSRHLLQRYWQRKRVAFLKELADGSKLVVDIGSGSSKFTQSDPNTIAVDISRQKLRFLRSTNKRLLIGSAESLPIASDSADCLIYSQVLPYLNDDPRIFSEMRRVAMQQGCVVISVPDSAKLSWKMIGFLYQRLLPNMFSHKHKQRFTRRDLADKLAEHGFRTEKTRYILGAEMVLRARKVD